MRLPRDVQRQFQAHGRRGGRTRAERLSPEARRAIARGAALRRWIRVRFGSPRFAALGLPGGAMIDSGLDALLSGKETIESLAVSLAAPRLEREGVPVPKPVLPDADRLLYRLLEAKNADLAHARYLSVLRQVASFADACHLLRENRARHAA